MFATPPNCLTRGFLVRRSRASRNSYYFVYRRGALKAQTGRESGQNMLLMTPKFRQWCDKLRATHPKGRKQKEWTNMRALMYDTDCTFNDHCKTDCNKTGNCKSYIKKTNGGIAEVKRLNHNPRIPIRKTSAAAGYYLAAGQSAVW